MKRFFIHERAQAAHDFFPTGRRQASVRFAFQQQFDAAAVLGRAQKILGPKADNLQFLFVTVDPARDTPAVLGAYVESGGFPTHVIGLTGTDTQIAEAAKVYRATYQKEPQPDGTYIMAHTDIVYLMDPKGRFTVPLTGDMSPQQVADQIAGAQTEYAAHN